MNKFLSEIAIFKNGKKRPNVNGEIPVYGGNNILGYTNSYNYENCIIVGRVGAYCGNVYYTDKKCWVSDNAIAVLPRKDTNILYLYYLLKSLNLNTRSVGSSQPLITQEILNSIICNIPEENIQEKIAKMLYTLDLKIKCNELINDNLEKQAKTIFEKCFPDINNGSDIIGKVIVPKRGKNLLSKNAVFGDIPVIAGGLEPTIYHNIANTIPPVITISASGANAGYVNLWNRPVWSSDSSFIDSSMTKNVYFWYILLKDKQKEIFESQTGSAQPHIYPKHIAELKINIPSKESIQEFSLIITPFFEHISKNLFENDKLSNIRNAILPKLISGNIDISNI
ncbi:restriction endonuclease subunit S [Phascolarctobacterium faecium]|nr:restriction endonuclease subunit S [Phascolarctobacterium faecium]MDM8109360.1 restriction endonuclease subunit S [Phascolarctobacterium faecium]